MLLQKELDELEKMIPRSDMIDPKISAKGVDWHIDHSLKVIIGIIGALRKSDPLKYRWKFSLPRLYIFTRNSFPRGKGRSPKAVLPPDLITKKDIHTQLEEARKRLNELVGLESKNHFKHPLFGVLNLRQSKRFLKLHTMHHLKIVKDIVG